MHTTMATRDIWKKLVVVVARKLLQPTLRKRMSDALDVVEMLAINIRDTHAAWNCPVGTTEEVLAEADAAIEHASLTECVLAAVSLIVDTNGGDEAQEYAREMLDDQIVKDASFPASLRSLLRAMVSTAP